MSTAEILTIFEPNPDYMRIHLEILFQETFDQPDGLIELAWTNPEPDASGRYRLSHARLFRSDQIPELIAQACHLNKREKCNVYVGAGLRKSGTPLRARTSDPDFLSARVVWADLDDEGSVERAEAAWSHCPPSLVVQTGAYPYERRQAFWVLAQWVDDPKVVVDLLRRLQGVLRSDPSVVQAGRVMRLAGSIAWDIKSGRVPEMTSIVSASGHEYWPEEIGDAFPVVPVKRALGPDASEGRGVAVRATNVVREIGEDGREGKVIDGRETHMRDLICAVLMEMIGTDGAVPSKRELFDKAWPSYERGTDLTREGRGRDEFLSKCGQTLRRFERGAIPGMRTVEETVETYNAKRMAEAGDDFEDLGEDEEAKNLLATLEQEARQVAGHDAYKVLCDKVRRMGERQLTTSMRSSLGVLLHSVFAKGVGMSVAEVKKDLKRKTTGKKVANERGYGGDDGDGSIERPEWLKDWVFCQATNTYERISVRHSIKREAFRTTYDSEPEVVAAETDAVTFARLHCKMPVVAALMFWPGEPSFFEMNGMQYLNTYVASGQEPCETLEGDEDGQGVVDLFMAHVRNLIPSEREQRILLNFMAYVYRNPGKRVRWAVLIHGIEGAGKTFFFNIMQRLLGHNAKSVSTTAINSDFTGWAAGAVLINVDEIRIAGTNKYAILDKMKPMITDDTITVIFKNENERPIPNFASYMMSTNHADAIPVGDNDRRYCVISTRYTRKEDLYEQLGGPEAVAAYFERLFSECQRRVDALGRMLLDWEIDADFNPEGRAPETDGLLAMRSLNVSEERDDLETLLEKHACKVIGPDIIDVTELRKLALIDGDDVPKGRALGHILSDMGYTQIPNRKLKLRDRSNHYVWFRKGRIAPQEAVEVVRQFSEKGDGFEDVPF